MAMRYQPPRPTSRSGFEIAVICALPLEADAVEAVIDHHWDEDGPSFGKAPGDLNTYSAGTLGRHNVVLAHMPGMGKATAATVAANIRSSFPNIKLAMVVGICGCVPFKSGGDEVILGDVIISNGVVQYDFGRRTPEGFAIKNTVLDSLGRPNAEVRGLLSKLAGHRSQKRLRDKMALYLEQVQRKPSLNADYPGVEHDRLYEAAYRHVDDGSSCKECDCNGTLITRMRLNQDSPPQPAVHFGLIASGDTVLKSGQERDIIAQQAEVIGFEMESAGVWDSLPCVVIKGACDYADSHKAKAWQRYAAATAAVCMKAFLEQWVSSSWQPATQESTATPLLTPVISIPFLQNKNFVGRDAVLEDLRQKLLIEQDCQTIALVGLGGVGKTQVALQFAYSVKSSHPDFSILWVSALSRASFEQTYLEVGKKLSIPIKDDKNPMASIRDYLTSDSIGKWLLIVDNADDDEVLQGESGVLEYLPQREGGLTLFTTRSLEVGLSVAGTHLMDLLEMTEGEAKRFLEKTLLRKQLLQDDAITKEFLNELTHLPLAIAQAAAYLNRNRSSIQRYMALLRSAEQELVSLMSREFQDNTRYRGSHNAVATTWIVSFENIRKADPLAADLLSFIAFVEPKAIPRSLLPRFESEEGLENAIGTLSAYAFLVSREDTSDDFYDMHSLVHLATRVWVRRQDSVQDVLSKALRHTNEVFPSKERANRSLWQSYLPHVLRLLDRSRSCEITERFDLCFRVGQCLHVERRFKDAIGCFEEASRWRAAQFSEDEEERLSVDACLAGAYRDDRRMKDAIKILEHVVQVRRKTFGEEDQLRLSSERELANAYLDDRRVDDAIVILEHVVEVQKRTLEKNDDKRITSEYTLASAYLNSRRIEDAISILEMVVAVQRLTLDETDQARLESEHELGSAYLDSRRIKDAIVILEHVVEVGERTLDEEDSDRLASEHVLATAYLGDGRIKEAIEMLEHIVEVCGKTLKEEDHSRLTSEHVLAKSYLDDGRPKDAIRILRHVVEMQARILKEQDYLRLRSECVLGEALLEDGQVGEALIILENVVVIQQRAFKEDDYLRLLSEYALGKAYRKDGRADDSIQLLESVAEVQAEALKPGDNDRLATESELAAAYLDDGRFGDAVEWLEHVVQMQEGTTHEENGKHRWLQDMLRDAREKLEAGSDKKQQNLGNGEL